MRESGRGVGSSGGRTLILGVGLIIALHVGTGHAFQQIRLPNPEGGPDDEFGFAVSIAPLLGQAVAVGSPSAVVSGRRTGTVHLFVRDGGASGDWRFAAQLFPDDLVEGDRFGHAVAMTSIGIGVAAGAPEAAGPAGVRSGAAYLFNLSPFPDPPIQVRLAPADGLSGDLFGTAVALMAEQGSVAVVVGAPGHDAPERDSGAAYILEPDSSSPGGFRQLAKLVPSDGAAGDRFGAAVAVSGDVVIVGAPGADRQREDAGAAYVFARDQGGPGRWGQVARLTKTDEDRGALPPPPRPPGLSAAPSPDRFGTSVAIAGDVAVVGAPGENGIRIGAGAAYVFYRDRDGPDRWGQVAEITAAGAGRLRDAFGTAVAVDGDRLLVGSPGDAGAVYLFDRNQGGLDGWGRVAKILALDEAVGGQFGHSVSVFAGDPPTGVVGAPRARGGTEEQLGAAYVLADLGTLETRAPVADSFIRRNDPNRNEGANPRLRINESGRNRAVVAFGGIPNVELLRRATLVLTIARNANNWGRDGRPVQAQPFVPVLSEGNGKSAGLPGSERTRGEGAGVTWNCDVDLAIENHRPDCADLPSEIIAPSADPVLHLNGLRGEVAWDVTADVINHGVRAWTIRKAEENRSGEVWYYSREGAEEAGNPDLGPRLLLEFASPGAAP